MKNTHSRTENPTGKISRVGPAALHGSASSPGLPSLAGAQNPGPGTRHLLYGEDGRLTDAAADPWELEGHLGERGGLRHLINKLVRR